MQDDSPKPAPIPISLQRFANLVASISRLLVGLANIPIFSDGSFGLAEWIALSVLSQNEGIGNKQLAIRLGVTSQRANQIVTALSNSGLVSVSQSTLDARRAELRLTQAGRAAIEATEGKLKPLLEEALAGREGVLIRSTNNVRVLMNIVNLGKKKNG